jgi:hypothetical protein
MLARDREPSGHVGADNIDILAAEKIKGGLPILRSVSRCGELWLLRGFALTTRFFRVIHNHICAKLPPERERDSNKLEGLTAFR